MKTLKIILPLFILVAGVQLYVPAKMIRDREEVLGSGTEYKFKTAPIDPSDPFRGKYITLNFDENIVEVSSEQSWQQGETIFVLLATDSEGFAKAKSITKERPSADSTFVEAIVNYVMADGSNQLTISYPFDRYYMDETKAYEAEQAYFQSVLDTTRHTYALVNVKKGEAVLKDVMIDGVSIKELVGSRKEQQ